VVGAHDALELVPVEGRQNLAVDDAHPRPRRLLELVAPARRLLTDEVEVCLPRRPAEVVVLRSHLLNRELRIRVSTECDEVGLPDVAAVQQHERARRPDRRGLHGNRAAPRMPCVDVGSRPGELGAERRQRPVLAPPVARVDDGGGETAGGERGPDLAERGGVAAEAGPERDRHSAARSNG
jgi:hypothetical protein